MALLHFDGFDNYSNYTDCGSIYTLDNTSYTNLVSGGRFPTSSKCIYGWDWRGLWYVLDSPKTTLFTGIAFYLTNVANYGGNPIFWFTNTDGQTQLQIKISTAGVIYAYTNSNLGSASKTVTSNRWYYLSVGVTFSDTTGAVQIYLDGEEILNLTNVDTQANGNLECQTIKFESPSRYGYLDDFYVADDSGTVNNTIIPEVKVISLAPNADTTQKDFLPSTGTDNYAMIDEASQDGDSSYVYSSYTGDEDLYEFEDLPADVSSVKGIKTMAKARKTDADIVQSEFVINSNSIENTSNSFNQSTTYVVQSSIFNLDPNGDIEWTPSSVNSLKAGLKTV